MKEEARYQHLSSSDFGTYFFGTCFKNARWRSLRIGGPGRVATGLPAQQTLKRRFIFGIRTIPSSDLRSTTVMAAARPLPPREATP
jgi:hypothetical protein